MIILNTTFHVHLSVIDSFKKWVREEYFPIAVQCKGLSNPLFSKILIEVQEGYASFAVQISASDIDVAANWHDGKAAKLRGVLEKKYGDKVLYFTTYLETLPID